MSAEAESRLLAAWRGQLALEHRRICWLYKLELTTPVFEISEGQGRAGAWAPGCNVLSLAAWLIRDHAWEVVIEVLKHEMAHQLVWQSMGRGAELPHGPAFHEACDRLGVHPKFRAAQGAVPRLPGGSLGRSGGLLARVEKLFALARSANEHEAALAMEKANAILRRYNLERLEQAGDGDYDYLVLKPGARRLASHLRGIAALLNDFFYVNVVISAQFEARSGATLRVIELVGARENLAVAGHVYHFLVKRLAYLWQGYQKRTGAAGREKNSYRLGVLHGFRDRLDEQERATMRAAGSEASSDLILAADPGLISYRRARYPRLRTVRHPGPLVYPGTYRDGEREGRRLVIHQGISSSAGNRGVLLDR